MRATGILSVCVLVSTGTLSAQRLLDFDGGDRVTIPNSAELNPSQITVECEVNFGRIAWGTGYSGTDSQFFICKGGDTTAGLYRFNQSGRPDGTRSLSFGIGTNPPYAFAVAVMPLETDRWYHVAGTYDGNDVALYVDGSPVADAHAPGLTVGNSKPLYLSYNDVSGYPYYLTGQLDEVRVWNYARREQEIRSTMWRSLTGQEPGLVAYWDFEGPIGSQTVYDRSGNGNDGWLGATLGVDPDDPTRIPEPATLSLLALGAMATIRRKQRPWR